MHVVESPALAPGSCALTGTSEGPFVDTLIDDDTLPLGRVYISEAAVVTMAGMFGMATKKAHDRIKARAKDLEAELAEVTRQRDEARDLLTQQANVATAIKELADAP